MATVDVNGTLIDFPDDLSPDQLQAAVASAAAQMGGSAAPAPEPVNPLKMFEQSQLGSPMQLLQMVPDLASQVANKAGTVVAEDFARKGMNPYASAAIGTLAAMSPDIAMSSVNPLAGAGPQRIPGLATITQRRALGIASPELKTSFGRKKAAVAARQMIEQGVVSKTGSPQELFDKASGLKTRVGSEIGDIRKKAPAQPVDKFIDALDDYKASRLEGSEGGAWDKVASKIEEAKDTIGGLVKKKLSKAVGLDRVAAAKKELSKLTNWFSDNMSQDEAKSINRVIERAIEDAIAESGGDIKRYKTLKPIYGASKTALLGLNRELGKQQGNMAVGLPALVAGASGGPAALLKVGIFEAARRRGAGVATSELLGAARAPERFGVPAAAAAMAPFHKKLDEEKIREYLRKAKGNKAKAREMIRKDGYEIPR